MRVAALLLGCVGAARSSLIQPINSDEEFEATVMNDASVWAVLFTAASREQETQALLDKASRAAQSLAGQVKFGVADVDMTKAVASEFNVRKRMLPRVLVFPTRARQAEILRESDFSADAVVAFLGENPKVDAAYQKLTLSIGGGGKDEP